MFIADSSDIMLSRVGPGGLLNVNLLAAKLQPEQSMTKIKPTLD